MKLSSTSPLKSASLSPPPVVSQCATTSLTKYSLSNIKLSAYNWFLLSIPSIAFFGCQLSWSLQNGFVTPQLESYGISDLAINYVWLSGPITGIIVQPVIGVCSDSMKNKQNRRRPFILLGTILMIISLLIFSNAYYIYKDYALIIGITSFWILDISTNITQAPLRALISDIIPKQYHSTSNSLFGLFNGIGLAVGYGLGFSLSYNQSLGGGLTLLYFCGSIIIAIASIITLIFSKGEELLDNISFNTMIQSHVQMGQLNDELAPLSPIQMTQTTDDMDIEDDENGSELNEINGDDTKWRILRVIYNGICSMPTPIYRAFIVQHWVYFAHFAVAMYLTDWFGKNIMNGLPNSDDVDIVKLYQKGIQYANIGLFIMSLLSIPISLSLPYFCDKYGYILVWFISLLIYGILLVILSFLRGPEMIGFAILLISLISVPFAASQVIGWTIVTQTLSNNNDHDDNNNNNNNNKRALYTTIFNLSQCFPEIMIALNAGWIIQLFHHDVSSIFIVGGIGCFIGCISSCFLQDPRRSFS